MSSSLFLQQCPACLVCLIWMVFEVGGHIAFFFVGCCLGGPYEYIAYEFFFISPAVSRLPCLSNLDGFRGGWSYSFFFVGCCLGVHTSTSLMSSSLFLQQCPACLVCLIWMVFEVGGHIAFFLWDVASGVHTSTLLMSSSLFLQQCPACLVCLIWMVFEVGGHTAFFVGCCLDIVLIIYIWILYY